MIACISALLIYEIQFNEFYFNFCKISLFITLWAWQSTTYLQVFINDKNY